jgi:hypothetical protein
VGYGVMLLQVPTKSEESFPAVANHEWGDQKPAKIRTQKSEPRLTFRRVKKLERGPDPPKTRTQKPEPRLIKNPNKNPNPG